MSTPACTFPSTRDPEWNHEAIVELAGSELEVVVVSECGEVRADGDWHASGERDGRPYYTRDGDSDAIISWHARTSEWRMTFRRAKENGDVYSETLYCSREATASMPTSGWETVKGASPPPRITTKGDLVAARPNMHCLFEVMEFDAARRKDVILAQASVPLTDVLCDLASAEFAISADVFAQKMDDSIAPPKAAAKEFHSLRLAAKASDGEIELPREVRELRRELRLVSNQPARKAVVDSGQKHATPESPSKAAKGGKAGGEADDQQGNAPGTRKDSKVLQQQLLATGQQLTQSLGTALEAIGLGYYAALEDHSGKLPSLVVRFEVVSRWKGEGRSAKNGRPVAKPMSRPSTVTCLAPLVSSVVAGHECGNIFIWDTTGTVTVPLHQLEAHRVPVSGLVFLPKLNFLVSTGTGAKNGDKKLDASHESMLKVWNCSTMDCNQTISLQSASTRCLRSVVMRGSSSDPCIALGSDTRHSRQLRLFKIGGSLGE
jgi:hypothetical protein